MRLIAYPVSGEPPRVVPAGTRRGWMDLTPGKFAYHCLPLVVANSHGWEILCDGNHTVHWDGTNGLEAVTVVSSGGRLVTPCSHFGSGIVTFHTGVLFRTEKRCNLFVTGPINRPKDGIQALSGIVETDWAPFTFTMNWMFTRAGAEVEFRDGDPICHIFPIPRGFVEKVEPEFVPLSGMDKEQYEEWHKSRDELLKSHSGQRQKVYAKGVNETRVHARDFKRGA
jgi:hypothetical protein